MATILDVATKAGVGVGTVSRVLNHSPHVSDATRAKVQVVIDQLGFRPSAVARALSSGRNATIGLVVHFFGTPSVAERLRGVIEVIGHTENQLVLGAVDTEKEAREYLKRFMDPPARGLLLLSMGLESDEVARFEDLSVPVVAIDHLAEGIDHFFIDNEAGGRMATEHLIELGHKRIAMISEEENGDLPRRPSWLRQKGYEQALADAGLGVDNRLIKALEEHDEKEAAQATRELLALDDPPTAIFAASDNLAYGALLVARELGLRVPDELSVVGFDDIAFSDAVDLTTIRQPLAESGRAAAELLLQTLNGTEAPRLGHQLELKLIVRNSTAPPS